MAKKRKSSNASPGGSRIKLEEAPEEAPVTAKKVKTESATDEAPEFTLPSSSRKTPTVKTESQKTPGSSGDAAVRAFEYSRAKWRKEETKKANVAANLEKSESRQRGRYERHAP